MAKKLKEEKKKKPAVRRMRFRTYPYTVTRVKVMKSKLLRRSDYERMKKMGINGVIRLLEESEYKREIDMLSKEFRGMELIELALNQNLANTLNKLIRISLKEEVRMLISYYSDKWVIGNIKLVLRAKLRQLGENELKYGLIPITPATYDFCYRLYHENADEIFEDIGFMFGMDPEEIKKFYSSGDLVSLENELDRFYYMRILEVSKKLRLRKSDPLKEFFDHLIHLVNIKNLMRFKKIGADEKIIKSLIFFDKKDKAMAKLLKAENLEVMFKELRSSRYKDLVTPELEKNISFIEDEIEKFLLEYSFRLLHRRPLSISPIFGYLLGKEAEIKNLRLLVHSKSMGLGDEFIDSHIILPKRDIVIKAE